MALGSIVVRLTANTGSFETDMGRAAKAAQRRAKEIDASFRKAGMAIGVALGAGAVLLRKYVQNSIEAEKVQAQLTSRIKDTGAAAGRSIQQLNAQAEKLQGMSVFDDETIGGAQAMLLTFKQVQGLQFDKAIESTLDLATVMGMDATNAAKLLGKALADPEKGMGALAKAGVVFTDAERAVITAMKDAGDVAGAQDAILKKLEGTMGSAAESARNTLGGALQGLMIDFNNMLEGDANGGGLKATVESINDLSAVMRDPQTQAGFDAIASGIASVTAQVLQGIAIMASYVQQFMTIRRLASSEGKRKATYDQLNTRLAEVSTDIGNVQNGGVAGLAKSIYRPGSTLTQREKMTSFPGDKGTLERLKKERTEIIRRQTELLRQDMVDVGVAKAFDGLPVPVVNMPKLPAVGGGARSSAPRRSGSGGSGASRAAAIPDFIAGDREAIADAIQREAEMVERANVAYLDMAASYGGPLAEAQREHIKNLDEIAKVGKDAMRTPEEIKKLSDAEIARYKANVDGIKGMSTAMQEQKAFMDGIRGQFNDFFMGVFTGTKTIKDSFKDLFDGIAQMITQKIVTGWLDKLFGAPGTTGAGTGGGDIFGKLLGMLFGGGFGGPRANGGPVSRGRAYMVGERGPEMFVPQTSGRIMNRQQMTQAGPGGSSMTVNQVINVPRGTEYRSASQVGQSALAGAQRAMVRNR